MNIIKEYTFFLEKRNLEEREKVSVSHRIVNFLNKFKYEYEGVKEDSKIFISFKTGDFETIIPSRSLGGSQYTSPQGLYCFDMNGFKQRLFGDDEIGFDTFSAENLKRGSNVIGDLGLGFGNNGNSVDNKNIWDSFSMIPRYLYFVKVKDGSLILSSNSNALKFFDPMTKLLKLYSHNFLKDNESKVFDPKDKRGEEFKNKSFDELKKYFTENKDKYKTQFTGNVNGNPLVDLMKAISKDEKKLHVKFYNFLLSCCSTINDKNEFVRFTLLCKSIGVDGFTQRIEDGGYIHPSPKYQTLLLTESCVEDLMKIDLKTELRTDKYVDNEKAKQNWDEFTKNLKPEDILYDKKNFKFFRFSSFDKSNSKVGNREVVLNDKDRINKNKNFKFNPEGLIKVDLSNNKIWKFIKTLKVGDWIKISSNQTTGSSYGSDVKSEKKLDCLIIQFKKLEILEDKINIEIRGKKFVEDIRSTRHVNFDINGEHKNPSFPYDISKKDTETPLFDPQRINPVEYKYWIDNKSELEKQGLTWDSFIDEYDKRYIVNNLEELFTNREYTYDSNRVRYIEDDIDLLNFLTDFNNKYIDRVYHNYTSFNKKPMTLYMYRGNLDKPIKVIYSDNPQF
jgi:hypothetical protein